MAHPQRIGFVGGTFDPVHLGHVRLAAAARDALRLDSVLLAPTGRQPLKNDQPIASWQQRMHMVELAIAGEPRLQASAVDAPRAAGGANYTVEAIAQLRDSLPPETQIWLTLGADAFAHFPRWRQPERLLTLVDIAVASRPGFPLPLEGDRLLSLLPPGTKLLGREQTGRVSAHVFLCGAALFRLAALEELAEDISATQLRHDLAAGRSWDWLTPAEADYIRQQHLYGA